MGSRLAAWSDFLENAAGCLDVVGATEFRIRKDQEDGGGTAFADYVWKPVVLIEMKKRGTDLQKHYRQAFDCWTRLVPNFQGEL